MEDTSGPGKPRSKRFKIIDRDQENRDAMNELYNHWEK